MNDKRKSEVPRKPDQLHEHSSPRPDTQVTDSLRPRPPQGDKPPKPEKK